MQHLGELPNLLVGAHIIFEHNGAECNILQGSVRLQKVTTHFLIPSFPFYLHQNHYSLPLFTTQPNQGRMAPKNTSFSHTRTGTVWGYNSGVSASHIAWEEGASRHAINGITSQPPADSKPSYQQFPSFQWLVGAHVPLWSSS